MHCQEKTKKPQKEQEKIILILVNMKYSNIVFKQITYLPTNVKVKPVFWHSPLKEWKKSKKQNVYVNRHK